MSLIFVCVFDNGSRELGLNYLLSLKKQGITNYMAYVTDANTYEYISSKGFNVEKEIPDQSIVQHAKDFGTGQFNIFSYIRYKVIHRLLLKYKVVWYMDVDTVVLGDLNRYYTSQRSLVSGLVSEALTGRGSTAEEILWRLRRWASPCSP